MLIICFVQLISSRGETTIFQHKLKYRLLSCNVHGFHDYHSRTKVINHFLYPKTGEPRPDVFMFQETHSTADVVNSWRKQFGKTGTKVLFSHGTQHSKGVILGFAESLKCSILSSFSDPDGHFITANVKMAGGKIV